METPESVEYFSVALANLLAAALRDKRTEAVLTIEELSDET